MTDRKRVTNQKDLPDSATFSRAPKARADAFALCWAKLSAAFPRQALGQATIAVYYERLKKYDPALIMAAVDLAIDRCVWFPTVAELLENISLVGQRRTQKQIEARPSKEEAQEVLKQLQTVLHDLESKDKKAKEVKAEARKAELKKQARALGVSDEEIKKAQANGAAQAQAAAS